MRRYFGMFISVRYKPSEDNIALKKLMELFKDRNSINYGMFELDIDPDMTVKQVAEKYRTQLKERAKKNFGEDVDINDVEVRIMELF